MISTDLIEIASFTPKSLQAPNAWVGHLPFAAWVMHKVSPQIFVELGTHSGNSYFSFCQAVVEAGISSRCYAVDTWQGDEHAGQYSSEIFAKVNTHHEEHYSQFSRLLRMTFDDAVAYFSDESIDLLHIDGLHTYEAVLHDFETWLPKLSPNAVVIFHDTNVRERNFGVWKLWEELKARYPNNLEFLHSNGLGVLQLNNAKDDNKLLWLDPGSPERQQIINYFAALGLKQLERYELNELKRQALRFSSVIAEQDEKIGAYHNAVIGRDEQLTNMKKTVSDLDEQIFRLNQTVIERDEKIAQTNQALNAVIGRDEQLTNMKKTVSDLDEQIFRLNQTVIERDEKIAQTNQALNELIAFRHEIYNSTVWKLSNPLRKIGQFYRKVRNFASQQIGQSGIKVLKYCYQRSSLSLKQKNLIRDFCFQHFPRYFHRIPSYEFWLARKVTNTSNLSGRSDFAIAGASWRLLLPVAVAEPEQELVSPRMVDIIIPVYRGLDQTRRCINSVLNSTLQTPFRLIVINDASPEVEINEYIQSLSSFQHVIIVENTQNLGFTATVNLGMMRSNTNDVLLLNSDAEVANNWLDKLKAHAYSSLKIGTVTPFSNNATICNYPTLDGMKVLPDDECTQSLDAACASANKGRNIEIPTAIGFCMYIRRECLNEVGLFDVETFGKGYGEENDFCLRATAKGWKHLLAADTFAFHEGEVSFQASSNPRKAHAMNVMRERYPGYEADVAKHVGKNEAYPLRVAATAARFRTSKLPVVLHILHSYGGGTEKHVEELCRKNYGKARLLVVTPAFTGSGVMALQLRSTDPVDALEILLPIVDVDFLVSLLQSFGVSLVHIHHVLGYSFNLQYLVDKLEVPFYLTVHDYMLICPRINLMPVGQKYCGEPEPSKCNQCLAVNYPQGEGDIIWWRESHAWLFNDATVVICPSNDVAKRCKRYFPNAIYQVVLHEEALINSYFNINVPSLEKNEPLRVAILGVLAKHKGLDLIAEALLIAKKRKALLQFQLIGYSESELPIVDHSVFSQTGHYVDSELEGKIDTFNPHLILFPASCPETYSYTLTAAMKNKRAIMASNLGAFPERLELRPWTWLMDWSISGSELVDKLCEIRMKNFYEQKAPTIIPIIPIDNLVSIENNAFYESDYLSAVDKFNNKKVIDIRKPGKIVVLVLIENVGKQPSPCAYIRLILPLVREPHEKLELRWVSAEQVKRYVADVLICQRTAVTSICEIDKIILHCHDNNIQIVYDIDDFLLALPDDHPEKELYAPKSAAVFRWISEADQVWVSTEALQWQISHINPCIRVIPNYMDDKLWLKPLITRKEGKDLPVRLLYMGTKTHNADFELVRKVLKRLKTEFSALLEVNLIGISENGSSEEWYRNIMPPQAIGGGYPAFVNWICNAPAFDIGIAPLVDNEFNRCKSAIKFLDYSALGLATVASDLNGYKLIANGVNGFKVNNTEEAWYESLKKLITDSHLRTQIQQAAQKEIFDKHGYASVYGLRTQLLTLLLSENPEKVNNVKGSLLTESSENLSGSIISVSRNTIASAFLSGVGIEVGALHNPLPIPQDAKVRYVDRMDKPSLYEQYPELRQHNLVDVDFVDNGETLLTFEDDSQDFIIANHFLEHCEDPIATLKAFFRVLRNGGVVFLALPDKRFSFDKNRQRTSLEHLIRDHLDGPITSRFEHFCEWPEFVEPHFGRSYPTREEIEHRARELMNQNYSIHYHVWEPYDVKDMLRYCAVEQQLPLVIDYFLSRDDEMIIILRKRLRAYH